MGGIGVAGELNHLVGGQAEDLLEALADVHENLLALLLGPALASGYVTIATVRDGATNGPGPDANSVEGLADVDDDTHDLTILLVLESLTDGGQHSMQPEIINVDAALVLEAVRPLAAMLVLGVLPFRANLLLEEVVVGFHSEVRYWGDIVLSARSVSFLLPLRDKERRGEAT